MAGIGDGDDMDGEGKLSMPDILASLTKEQRKELAALRVDEKKWKKEDRKKKKKKKRRKPRRDSDTGSSSDEDNDSKEKQHRNKHRSDKPKISKGGHRRKHSFSAGPSESDRAGAVSELRGFSSRDFVEEGSEDDERAADRERHHRHRHGSLRSKGREVHANDRDRDKQKAQGTVLDEVHESFKRQRGNDDRRRRHDDLRPG